MTYRVIVTPAAESDLRTAYRYISRQAPRAAREWIRRARQSAKNLARRPERCPLAPESVSFNQPIRELFFGSGNRGTYRFLFVVLDKSVTYCTFGMDPCSTSNANVAGGGARATRIYSGMLPCFFGGFLSRFVSSISRAWISFLRVSRGWITASTKPRSAAT
jgi:plasmid stabilization system protein ParE